MMFQLRFLFILLVAVLCFLAGILSFPTNLWNDPWKVTWSNAPLSHIRSRQSPHWKNPWKRPPWRSPWRFRNAPIRAAFLVLAYDSFNDVRKLVRCLTLLRKATASTQPKYPVLIFHDPGAFAPGSRHHTRVLQAHPAVRFVEAPLSVPPGFRADSQEFTNFKRGNWSYSKMIRFHSVTLARLPVMQQFDYYLRLDSDSLILSPFGYDPFEFMRDRGLVYGYRTVDSDTIAVVRNLSRTVEAFIQHKRAAEPDWNPMFYSPKRHVWANGTVPIFYNNFEVVDLGFQRSAAQVDFWNFIDATFGSFLYRWGDAPLRFIQMALFAHPDQLHCFCDIAYQHNPIYEQGRAECIDPGHSSFPNPLPEEMAFMLAGALPTSDNKGLSVLFGQD